MATQATAATATATKSASTLNKNRLSNIANLNARFISTATKPQGWISAWYNREMQPRKLESNDQINLIKQGHCWGCKGSGHRYDDNCCFLKTKKLNTIQAVLELEAKIEQAKNA